jgi:hypothetical protein
MQTNIRMTTEETEAAEGEEAEEGTSHTTETSPRMLSLSAYLPSQ